MGENPSAFPQTCLSDPGHPASVPGMSLRDWFATHAPVPSHERMHTERGSDRARNPYNEPHKPAIRSDDEIRAALAYRYADAMLAARQEPSS